MAYTLTYSGGTITVTDGTINTTSTSLALPGRNYAGYGSPVDQNMVSMLENFASYTSAPSNPIPGQLWYDKINTTLKYNTGTVGSPNWTSVVTSGGSATYSNLNVTGTISAATITATGTITGTNIVATERHGYGVETSISASGSDQSGAYLLSKEISVVQTVALNTGVKLPVAVAGIGLRFTVINTGANALNVYPNTGARINSAGLNLPYALAVGGRLDFLSTSGTQWYTLNSTYA